MSTTTHFEIFLTAPRGTSARRTAVLEALRALPFLKPVPGDPARQVYYNPDTTVHFELILGDRIVSVVSGEDFDPLALSSDPGHAARARIHDHRGEWEDESDDDDEDEDEDEWKEGDDAEDDSTTNDAAPIPPVTLRLPLFRPTFFLAEAAHVLEELGTRAGLQLTRQGDEDQAPRSKADLLEAWRQDHVETLDSLEVQPRLVTWSEERCRRFYDYAVSRGTLEDELAGDGIEVLRAQPAARSNTIATLCVWQCDIPAVLPQTDFVLLRRPRKRRFLLPTRFDELVVAWEDLEKILRTHAEFRAEPAPLFILRSGTRDSGQLEKELGALRGEHPQSTRRTELAGVVDFEPPQPQG